MSTQYKRAYELILSSEQEDGTIKFKSITGLRVNFEIAKSIRSVPNLLRLDLYNPNQETITTITGKNGGVIFNAGYEGNVKLLFKGQLRNTFLNKFGEDRVLTIYAGDGEVDYQTAVINKTFSEDVKLKDVLDSLIGTFLESGNTTKGEIVFDPDNPGVGVEADKLRGQTYSGSSKDAMNQLAEDYKFQWSIQNGELIIVPVDDVLSNSAILIKESTGMIGSPTVTELGADVTTLLNPELLPNRQFKIESESQNIALGGIQFRQRKRTVAEGLYKVFEVVFTGDTHGDAWYSTARGQILRNVGSNQ